MHTLCYATEALHKPTAKTYTAVLWQHAQIHTHTWDIWIYGKCMCVFFARYIGLVFWLGRPMPVAPRASAVYLWWLFAYAAQRNGQFRNSAMSSEQFARWLAGGSSMWLQRPDTSCTLYILQFTAIEACNEAIKLAVYFRNTTIVDIVVVVCTICSFPDRAASKHRNHKTGMFFFFLFSLYFFSSYFWNSNKTVCATRSHK